MNTDSQLPPFSFLEGRLNIARWVSVLSAPTAVLCVWAAGATTLTIVLFSFYCTTLTAIIWCVLTALHKQTVISQIYLTKFINLNKRHNATENHEQHLRLQTFMRDMLASVTDGKLTLCRSAYDLPVPLTAVCEPIPLLKSNGGLRELRNCTLEACELAGQPIERCYDLQTAVAEAAMNAVVHAGEGVGQILSNDKGTVQVIVSDTGTGISMENLPQATLRKGFTTAGTMGHGMKIMLQTADRVYLLTGKKGTIVVMEQDKKDADELPASLEWCGAATLPLLDAIQQSLPSL